MKRYFRNDEGLTLVEILAALVLLSIVLVSFMTFFTQSAKFTAHNHETLTAVQVAEDVVSIVRLSEKEDAINNNVCTEMKTKIRDVKKSLTFKKKGLNSNLNAIIGECEDFDVNVTISKKFSNLGRAVIIVKPTSGKGINNPEFQTEMYFEVNPT